MKSLVFSLAVLMFLVQLTSGNWYVKKCANRTGRCRSVCRATEKDGQASFQTCKGSKRCCVRIDADAPLTCDETTKPTKNTSESRGDADSPNTEGSQAPGVTTTAATGTTTSTGATGSAGPTPASTATTTTAASTATTTSGG